MESRASTFAPPPRLISRAVFLSWFTILYNLAEGVVSIWFGVSDSSMALAGFGVDSLIEVASAVLVLWRFHVESEQRSGLPLARERRATIGIGVLFFTLAVMTFVAAALQLRSRTHPSTTWPGMIVSVISLSFMFFLWSAKRKVGRALDSATVMKDAECSLACILLSAILFLGSALFTAFPSLWWIDAVAAMVLAALIGSESWETVKAARSPGFSGGCGCG